MTLVSDLAWPILKYIDLYKVATLSWHFNHLAREKIISSAVRSALAKYIDPRECAVNRRGCTSCQVITPEGTAEYYYWRIWCEDVQTTSADGTITTNIGPDSLFRSIQAIDLGLRNRGWVVLDNFHEMLTAVPNIYAAEYRGCLVHKLIGLIPFRPLMNYCQSSLRGRVYGRTSLTAYDEINSLFNEIPRSGVHEKELCECIEKSLSVIRGSTDRSAQLSSGGCPGHN